MFRSKLLIVGIALTLLFLAPPLFSVVSLEGAIFRLGGLGGADLGLREMPRPQIRREEESIPGVDGAILDRRGQVLRIAQPSWDILAKRSYLNEEHVAELQSLLGEDQENLDRASESRPKSAEGSPQRSLKAPKSGDSQSEQREAWQIIASVKGDVAMQVAALQAPGIRVKLGFQPLSPMGAMGMHFPPSFGTQSGISGLREMFSGGPHIPSRAGELLRLPEDGRNLTLTIDARLQLKAYKTLRSVLAKTGGKTGLVMLADPATGELLALAQIDDPDGSDSLTRESRGSNLRAMTEKLPFGVAAMPVVITSLLAAGRDHSLSIATSPGYEKVGGEIIRDHHDYGDLSLSEVVSRSSRVGLVRLIREIDDLQLLETLHDFGIGAPTGIGLLGEFTGDLPDGSLLQGFGKAKLINGHDLRLTPLQLLRVYATIANSGARLPLSLVKDGGSSPGSAQAEQVIPQPTAKEFLEILEFTSMENPATRDAYANSPYRILIRREPAASSAARSGWVQISARVGIAPASDPRLVALMLVPDSRGGKDVASAAMGELLATSLRMLGVSPDNAALFRAEALSVTESGSVGRGW